MSAPSLSRQKKTATEYLRLVVARATRADAPIDRGAETTKAGGGCAAASDAATVVGASRAAVRHPVAHVLDASVGVSASTVDILERRC